MSHTDVPHWALSILGNERLLFEAKGLSGALWELYVSESDVFSLDDLEAQNNFVFFLSQLRSSGRLDQLIAKLREQTNQIHSQSMVVSQRPIKLSALEEFEIKVENYFKSRGLKLEGEIVEFSAKAKCVHCGYVEDIDVIDIKLGKVTCHSCHLTYHI